MTIAFEALWMILQLKASWNYSLAPLPILFNWQNSFEALKGISKAMQMEWICSCFNFCLFLCSTWIRKNKLNVCASRRLFHKVFICIFSFSWFLSLEEAFQSDFFSHPYANIVCLRRLSKQNKQVICNNDTRSWNWSWNWLFLISFQRFFKHSRKWKCEDVSIFVILLVLQFICFILSCGNSKARNPDSKWVRSVLVLCTFFPTFLFIEVEMWRRDFVYRK